MELTRWNVPMSSKLKSLAVAGATEAHCLAAALVAASIATSIGMMNPDDLTSARAKASRKGAESPLADETARP